MLNHTFENSSLKEDRRNQSHKNVASFGPALPHILDINNNKIVFGALPHILGINNNKFVFGAIFIKCFQNGKAKSKPL